MRGRMADQLGESFNNPAMAAIVKTKTISAHDQTISVLVISNITLTAKTKKLSAQSIKLEGEVEALRASKTNMPPPPGNFNHYQH